MKIIMRAELQGPLPFVCNFALCHQSTCLILITLYLKKFNATIQKCIPPREQANSITTKNIRFILHCAQLAKSCRQNIDTPILLQKFYKKLV